MNTFLIYIQPQILIKLLNCDANMRKYYCGFPLSGNDQFDTELVSSIIASLSHGKAAGLDGLTSEHLINCFPISLSRILTKLFNLMLLCCYVPPDFGCSYTVPLPKIKETRSVAMTCDDFRGIAVSPILSKVFEHCILRRFQNFFVTSDNQFGFKKNLGCNQAIYTVRNYNSNMSTMATMLTYAP